MYMFKNLDAQSKDYVIRADSMDDAAKELAYYFNTTRARKLFAKPGKWLWSKVTSKVIHHTYKLFVKEPGRVQYFVVHEINDKTVTEI